MDRVKAFHKEVFPLLQGLNRKNLIDCCAGDGRAGVMFSEDYERIIFIDIKEPNRFKKNTKRLKKPFESFLRGIKDFSVPGSSVIIAIHACGEITDRVLEKAVSTTSPVAVMPCCYNQRMKRYRLLSPPDNRRLLYPSEKDYYDAFRLQFLREQGYRVFLRTINPRITPMNNVLIGLPNP